MARISGVNDIYRVLRVSIAPLNDYEWNALRDVSYLAAGFCNQALAYWYCEKKWGMKADKTTFVDYSGQLSSYVREGANGELKGIVRRLGKRILNADQGLPVFSVDRSLAIRADAGHGGAEVKDGIITIKPYPRGADPIRLSAKASNLAKDHYLAGTLQKIESGEYLLTKAVIRFKRPGRNVVVHLSYVRTATDEECGKREATLDYNETGEMWLASKGQRLNLTHFLFRLGKMKNDFAAIHSRFRRCLGKAGKRRELRRGLLNAGSYEKWADGPIQQMTAAVLKWSKQHSIGILVVCIPADGTLPWSRISFCLKYKCEGEGIEFREVVDEERMQDWGRIKVMLEAQRKLVAQGPIREIVAV